ncbi:hypothetical protein V6N13_149463 [Hibiscus sabdariffa]
MYGNIIVERSEELVGLLLFWTDAIDVSLLSFSESHIDVEVKDSTHHYRFTSMYGTSDHSRKHEDWALLDVLRARSTLPWLVGGDLNVILCREKRRGDVGSLESVKDKLETMGATLHDWQSRKRRRAVRKRNELKSRIDFLLSQPIIDANVMELSTSKNELRGILKRDKQYW